MNNNFAEFTTNEGPILLGIANIVFVEPNKKEGGTVFTFNIARGSDLYPKKVYVLEEYEAVRAKLGLSSDKPFSGFPPSSFKQQ